MRDYNHYSPVKRLDENGNPTSKGRQIDCYIGDQGLAYELKLRVTIAASGQGRFGEELSFPAECKGAGLIPVLLVLDPTPSARLDDLSKAFEMSGGRVFVGSEAWAHMESQAGRIMSIFLEKYIKPPLQKMSAFDGQEVQDMQMRWTENHIVISIGPFQYRIDRV